MIAATDILKQAVHSHERGDFVHSESLCRQILRFDPGHRDALYLLGLTAAAQNHGEEAIQKFEQLASLCPHSADVHQRLAHAYTAAGLLEEAVSASWKAVELRPIDERLYCHLGILLQRLGETGGAIACFQQARELQPASSAAARNLAVILDMNGRSQEAIAVLQESLRTVDNAELRCTLAALLKRENRQDEARQHYEAALRSDPDCVMAQFELGERLRAERRFFNRLIAEQ